jgi:hypothetical protein
MSVLVRIGNRKAIFRTGVWISSDPGTETLLNEATDSWILATGGPPLNHPDPEHAAAHEVIRRVGGAITVHIPAHRRMRKHFFTRRQMRLEF